MTQSSSNQIAEDLRAEINQLKAGTQLPSSRQLVKRFRASPVTVQRAVHQLVADGAIESRPGVGMFVRAVQMPLPADYGWQTEALRLRPSTLPSGPSAMREAANDVISLHSGYPDSGLLPTRLLRAALTRAARGDAAVTRPPANGLPGLQTWFSQELAAQMSPGVNPPAPNDVIVTPGSQSALTCAFRALTGAHHPLILESPTYWGAIHAAVHAGLQMIPIPSSGSGPDPAQLDRAFRETGARVFYAQPHCANPTGGSWSAQLAREVLDVVRAHGAFIVEDDWARDLAFGAPPTPLACLDDAGHVLYLRSLTKSISNSIRVAALIARGPARERIAAGIATEAMYVSGVLQAAALDVVTQPSWNAHRRAVTGQLRDRRDLLLQCLRAHAPQIRVEHVPQGGLNLWARLPDGTDVDQLALDCERAGLLIAPGTDWFPAEPSGPYIRLGYAGADPNRFVEAARILGRMLS